MKDLNHRGFSWRRAAAPLLVVLLLQGVRARADQLKPAPASQPAKQHAFMWKVTSPTTTVYLLGSMHLATDDIYPLSPDIETAFKDSAILGVEVNINKIDQLEMMRFVGENGLYKPGDSLEKHVTPEVMEAFKAYCKKHEMSVETSSKMKPWLLCTTLEVTALQKLGLDPSLGVDKHFLDEAGKKKKIVELETMDEQLKLLSGLGEGLEGRMLEQTIKETDELKGFMERMVKAWKEGDAAGMEALLLESYGKDEDSKKVVEKMIYDRNGKMADKVEELLKGDKPAFVVVGAAHLVGDRGVIKLLEKKKFTVDQPEVAAPPPAKKKVKESPARKMEDARG